MFCRRIAEGLENYIPNLETLVLTGNLLLELADIDPLTTLPNLTSLSLLHCPVAGKQHYRQYIAFKFPRLKLLDFRKIKMKVKTYKQYMLQNISLSCGNSKFCFYDCRFSFILSVDLSLQSVYILNLNHFML